MATSRAVDVAREVRLSLAGSRLTNRQAILYSQRLRRDMGREGLGSFAPSDVDAFLDEAMLLLQCGLIEGGANPASDWRDAVKRAADILEWLSQPSLRPAGAPLHLLAAAAFQVAGYPAMALGHLRRVADARPSSEVLRSFLRGDFPAAQEAILAFWMDIHSQSPPAVDDEASLTSRTFRHVVMCISTVCAYLRTGDDQRVERALIKLDRLTASLVYSRDPYSYLLAELTAVCCRRFIDTSLWRRIGWLQENASDASSVALTQYARASFANRRVLVWPAQATGIGRLRDNSSFVLCTPTGSGKTTVATLAIVQSMLADGHPSPSDGRPPAQGALILYLVPSRALAAEVEGRLAEDLKGIGPVPVVVTGLYGGVDWGPTDVWTNNDQPTVVICTFEKADALLRNLGVLFLHRVRLVVVDEAHMVEQDPARRLRLEDGPSRALLLEQLGARLFRARVDYGFRVIALSAVAANAAPALARWIAGGRETSPVTASHRSTRQMLGRLEVGTSGRFAIHYDLMDGRSLRFGEESSADAPYVRDPFPSLPAGLEGDQGPEVRMRAPTFWAALHLAAEREDGSTPSVLISLTQNLQPFAATCADLMDNWPASALPDFGEADDSNELWHRCLASAADYFTVQSVEYRLLRRGVVVHHGKMPPLLARRLKTVIDRGLARVIIATSTLSEGVNTPVSFVLIPSLYRGPSLLRAQEFTNLVGRAGRPGLSTEGSALVVLPGGTDHARGGRQWRGYRQLVDQVERLVMDDGDRPLLDSGSSPLAQLLKDIETAWRVLTGGGTSREFLDWLEQTAVVGGEAEPSSAIVYLDSLDAFLIAALHEVEELRSAELTPDELEAELTAVWQRTYAFASDRDESWLSSIWLTRGRAIGVLYPDPVRRRRLYRTSLPPRSATKLLDLLGAVRTALQEGEQYARFTMEQRFAYIRNTLEILTDVPSFRIDLRLGSGRSGEDWSTVLRWWIARSTLATQPEPGKVAAWYHFVAQNFVYRGAWGLGSVIGVLLDDVQGDQPIRALEIDDWPRSGLPWIAFWIKELIAWGTLDPVASYLLARGDAIDRSRAESDAEAYYAQWPVDADPNDILDPRRIRAWLETQQRRSDLQEAAVESAVDVRLERPAGDFVQRRVAVSPLDLGNSLAWVDAAGYLVARSDRPQTWTHEPMSFDYELEVSMARVTLRPFRFGGR